MFEWDADGAAALERSEPDGPSVVRRLLRPSRRWVRWIGSISSRGRRGRRSATGLKGRALFHPIRVALTAADSGPELDLAVPAIDRGAALPAGQWRRPITSCAERAAVALC